MFRCEAEGVVPDILTYGKAFGGGIMPITGIIARPHLWVEALEENPWLPGSPTFSGNPLACSTALATISFLLENDIPRQAAEKGKYLKDGLLALQTKYPTLIQEVRGVGLMIMDTLNNGKPLQDSKCDVDDAAGCFLTYFKVRYCSMHPVSSSPGGIAVG